MNKLMQVAVDMIRTTNPNHTPTPVRDVIVKITHLDSEVEYVECPYPDALAMCSELNGLCISCTVFK